MKAAVMRGKQRLEIEDVPTPEPGPSEVLIKIKYNGLCGSDVHRFQYGAADNGSIMGHEYIGQVVQVGQDVTRWEEGDRVVGGGGPRRIPPSPPRTPPPLTACIISSLSGSNIQPASALPFCTKATMTQNISLPSAKLRVPSTGSTIQTGASPLIR